MKTYRISINEMSVEASVDIHVDMSKLGDFMRDYSETFREVETVKEVLQDLAWMIFAERYSGSGNEKFYEGFGYVWVRDFHGTKTDIHSDIFEISNVNDLQLYADNFEFEELD
jgi:hypothetical protein